MAAKWMTPPSGPSNNGRSAARPPRRPRALAVSDSSSRAAPGTAGTRPEDSGATKPSRQRVDQPVDLWRTDIEVGGSAHPPGARRSDDLLPAEEAHRLRGGHPQADAGDAG